jgi:type IX secretion system PorP/SprF family membrane protein
MTLTRPGHIIKLTSALAIWLLVGISLASAQQKMQFTQYMFNGVVINPAYAGADEALSLTFIQRNQWAGIDNGPSTQTLTGHTLFKKKQLGLGITLVNDKVGVHKNQSVLTNYAYHLHVGRSAYVSLGMQAGLYSLRSDYASLINGPSNDPKLADPFVSQTFFDFGAGIYYRSPRFHIGVSTPELIPQQVSISDTISIQLTKANLFIFSKYRIPVNELVEMEPSVLVKYLSGVPLSYDINANVIYRKVLIMGLSYRRRESVDFIMRAQVTRQLQFGYAYDHPIGIVSRLGNASHELMVNYIFRYVKKGVVSPRQ